MKKDHNLLIWMTCWMTMWVTKKDHNIVKDIMNDIVMIKKGHNIVNDKQVCQKPYGSLFWALTDCCCWKFKARACCGLIRQPSDGEGGGVRVLHQHIASNSTAGTTSYHASLPGKPEAEISKKVMRDFHLYPPCLYAIPSFCLHQAAASTLMLQINLGLQSNYGVNCS